MTGSPRSRGSSLSYVFQSIGELLISPVGYAMIGKLAPRQYQGIMMGAWMLVTGLASVFAGDFSSMVPEPSEGTARHHQPRLLEALRRARLWAASSSASFSCSWVRSSAS